jgi:lysophospholipase L1-like esterase
MSEFLEALEGTLSKSLAETLKALSFSSGAKLSKTPKICLCGDSITAEAIGSGSWADWGWATWFRRAAGQSIDLEQQDIFAVSSMGTEHLLNTQLPSVQAGDYDICITMIGTNDIANESIDLVANLETYISAIENLGIYHVMMPIMPRSGAAAWTADELKKVDRINAFIRKRMINAGFGRFISFLPKITDFSTGEAISGYLRDGIHTNKRSAKIIGDTVFSACSDLFPVTEQDFSLSNSTYDEAINPLGDIIVNGLMSGTTGITQNGATGDVATGWNLNRSSAAATFDIVGSKSSDTDLVGKENQVITFSGTGDGTSAVLTTISLTPPSGLVDGDELELIMDVDASSLTGIGYISASLNYDGTAFREGGATVADKGEVPSNFSAKMKIRGNYIGGTSNLAVRLHCSTVSGQAVSGTVTVKQASVRKVN